MNQPAPDFFPKVKMIAQLKGVVWKGSISSAMIECAKWNWIQLQDARIDIPKSVKDFGRIKKVVDVAPEVDRSEKIARLRQEIESGQYQIDYEQLADKIISQEF